MNYTQNLHLPQWQATDRIHHDDFNDAFDKIDAAVAAAGNCRVETQTYTGNGGSDSANSRSLTFTAAPFLVVINSSTNGFAIIGGQSSSGYAVAPMDGSSILTGSITATWSNQGKKLSWYASYKNTMMNIDSVTYTVYALYMV